MANGRAWEPPAGRAGARGNRRVTPAGSAAARVPSRASNRAGDPTRLTIESGRSRCDGPAAVRVVDGPENARSTQTKSRTPPLVEGYGSSSGSEQDKLPREVQVPGVWELVRVEGTRDHRGGNLSGSRAPRIAGVGTRRGRGTRDHTGGNSSGSTAPGITRCRRSPAWRTTGRRLRCGGCVAAAALRLVAAASWTAFVDQTCPVVSVHMRSDPYRPATANRSETPRPLSCPPLRHMVRSPLTTRRSPLTSHLAPPTERTDRCRCLERTKPRRTTSSARS
jgi:hypothetical protein